MSIIAINASPRPKRNTHALIQEVIAGCREVGQEVTLFQLGKMDIAPCNGCAACVPTAKCVVEDDMTQLYEAFDTAAEPKGLIVGTPVYFDHVSAQLKAVLDRLYSYTYTDLGQKMFPKGFKAVLVATFDDEPPDRYNNVLDWLAGRLEFYHEIETIAQLAQPQATAKPLSEHPELIAQARQAGAELAS